MRSGDWAARRGRGSAAGRFCGMGWEGCPAKFLFFGAVVPGGLDQRAGHGEAIEPGARERDHVPNVIDLAIMFDPAGHCCRAEATI